MNSIIAIHDCALLAQSDKAIQRLPLVHTLARATKNSDQSEG